MFQLNKIKLGQHYFHTIFCYFRTIITKIGVNFHTNFCYFRTIGVEITNVVWKYNFPKIKTKLIEKNWNLEGNAAGKVHNMAHLTSHEPINEAMCATRHHASWHAFKRYTNT